MFFFHFFVFFHGKSYIWEKKNNVSNAKVLSNGALLELDNEQSMQDLSWSEFRFFVSNLVDDNTAPITADFLCHYARKWPFYLSNFIIIKKLVVVFQMDGGASDVGAVMSTDTGVDNVANNNVTKVANNLDSKNFSRISVLEDQILNLKNSLSEENAEHLSLAIELKQLKKDFKKVNTELKIRLAKLSPHNFFNKRIKWQKQINKKLANF